MSDEGLIILWGSVYAVFAVIWAKHAINMQMLVTTNKWKLTLIGIMNFVFFPICWMRSLFTKDAWETRQADYTKEWRNQ